MAATLNIRAYGTDTVAGYPSLLKTSMLAPNKKVVFVVEKPDNSIVQIPAQADLQGVAKVDLYGNQTKKAGVYKVAVYYPGTKSASPQNTFSVFPDQTSKTQSTITSTSQMIEADGSSKSFITVVLYDANKNPIPNHKVKLISSLANVKIEALSGGVSDKQGRASFKITSQYTGASTFTPIDASNDTILESREEIVFSPPLSAQREIGGNYFNNGLLLADVLNDQNVLPGPVESFEIKDVPSSVKVNTDQTITIVAKDKDGNVAKNYTGTVVISTPEDDNSIRPGNGEYTFKEADQGKFTFNLALRFSQMGNQLIQVVDKDDWKKKGEFSVTVNSQQAINQGNTDSLVIKAPLDGAMFGTNSVLLSGQGDPNINLSIYADDMKVADTQTDTDGSFTYTFNNLSGGTHSFYAMSAQGQVSDTVNINIDTLPPVLNSLTIVPQGPVTPGKMLNITVNSEPNLSSVKVRLQGVIKDLFPVQGQAGNYSGNLAAPAILGSFPVDVVLVDDLSNKSELLNQKVVVIQKEAVVAPPQVKNVEGVAADGQVILTWDEVTGHSTAITAYNVYYGRNMNKLDQVAQTPTSQALYKVSGLNNGVQYFFSVTAVDSKGIESQLRSQVIATTPQGAVGLGAQQNPVNGLPVADQGIDLFDFDLFDSPSQAQAPQVTPPVNTPQASLYNNPLSGTPMNNGMSLSWQPFPGINAAGYKVYFGLSTGQYDDYVLAAANQTTLVVSDLINNVPYYFAVVALDAQGKEISPLSAQYAGTPSGLVFHGAAPGQTASDSMPLSDFELTKVPATTEAGMASTWIIIVSVLVSGGLYLGRRKLFN